MIPEPAPGPTSSVAYPGCDLEALADIPRYQNWLLAPFRSRLTGRVLEVGAGIGNLSEHYVAAAREVILVEPAEKLAGRLRERFAGRPHVRVIGGLLEQAAAALAPASFDACVLVNVLEHVEDDAAMLRRLAALLRPGGSLLLFVPALQVLYGTLDAIHHHHRRYAKSSLRRVVERASFTVQELRYFDVLGVVPWFLAGRVFRWTRFDAGSARIYDRFFVPLGERLERLHEPPLGKNLLCIAERPGAAA
jgi:SAM-dependent methyltransferase